MRIADVTQSLLVPMALAMCNPQPFFVKGQELFRVRQNRDVCENVMLVAKRVQSRLQSVES